MNDDWAMPKMRFSVAGAECGALAAHGGRDDLIGSCVLSN